VDKAKWLHIDIARKEIAKRGIFYTQKGSTEFGLHSLSTSVREFAKLLGRNSL